MVSIIASIAIMSIGYILQKKEIKGSCGGIASLKASSSNSDRQEESQTKQCDYCKKPINSCRS